MPLLLFYSWQFHELAFSYYIGPPDFSLMNVNHPQIYHARLAKAGIQQHRIPLVFLF
jgi:hypothetical protein